MSEAFDIREYWEERGRAYGVGTAKIEAEIDSLADTLRYCKPSSVLDVGSGWGRLFVALTRRKVIRADHYRMVDCTGSMRLGCHEKTGILPDEWDGVTLPYGKGEFDLVLAWDVLLHVSPADISGVFGEMARVARRWVFLTAPGVVYTLLARHCFWHDYLALFSAELLAVERVKVFRGGKRIHWLLVKRPLLGK